MMQRPALLFVCLGNICRSPLAEAACRHTAGRAGLDVIVDSAGTGNWHAGHPPDPRALAEALRHGIDISSCRARQVTLRDFRSFTHILALDHQNLSDLGRIAPLDGTASLSLLLDHVAGLEGQAVADPYYGRAEDFAETWRQVSCAAEALVRKIMEL
jgi:protein-tyrosine phosphatase